MPSMTEPDATQQLRELDVLDAASGAYGRMLIGFGVGLGLLGTGCPTSVVVGNLVESASSSGFVHRLAATPLWVVILMTVLSLGLAVTALVFGLKMRAERSLALAHLRAHPDDPFVAVDMGVSVRRGSRVLHVELTSRSGVKVNEVVMGNYEERVVAALAAAIPQPAAA